MVYKKSDADLFLDQVFSATERLAKTVGSDLDVDDVLKAAKELGFSFKEDELRAAIATRLQDRGVQLVRFCFSESPCV
jgi:hypothetical protein